MPKIFIVEDDENIRELVMYALKTSGYESEGFETGRDFLNEFNKILINNSNNNNPEELPSLILLDIMLPETDGLEILKRLRASERGKAVPVIILSAKGSEFDKVKGLDIGADDYVTKPFGVTELLSRINAVLRRGGHAGAPDDRINYKNIAIDKERRVVFVDGEKVMLTYKEYELLCYLLLNADIVLSRDKIMDAVWGYDFEGESRTVDMHVKTLRQKLGSAGNHIKTVRNVGYKIGE